MNKIPFKRDRTTLMAGIDAAYITDDNLSDQLAEAVIQGIETDVEIQLGGITVFLAMLRDPDHWESDWEERGVEDVDEFLAGLVEQE